MIFYGNIQIPRISGNFDACADSVYQALFLHWKGSLGSRLLATVYTRQFAFDINFPQYFDSPSTSYV